MNYVLLDKEGKEVKKVYASCYTEALSSILLDLGYTVEAFDNPVEKITKPEILPEETQTKITTVMGSSLDNPPFTYKNLEIFNMIKEKPCTVDEIVEKTKVAPSTAKQTVTWLFKTKGYFVKQTTIPGVNGILYSLK